ncbi:MAG: metal-dependent phosphohydrolase [Treponema sp.]|nr:metal-dependent phosphohydrolase [Treponema sp.]
MVAESKRNIPLKSILEIRDYIDLCLKEDIHIVCVNRETKRVRHMPFSAMYGNDNNFWRIDSKWDYFIAGMDLRRLNDKASKKSLRGVGSLEEEARMIEELRAAALNPIPPADDPAYGELGYGNEYQRILSMSEEERVAEVQRSTQKLETLMTLKTKTRSMVTEALVETVRSVVMHNHASQVSFSEDSAEESKKKTQCLVDSTRELVAASVHLISADIFNNELMRLLVSKSNGTIIQHMTRVYLNGLAFLAFYNKQVSSTHAINKIRVAFDEKYSQFYRSLLPHVHPDHITLERVFIGGMRAVSEAHLCVWATGFLVHDIGKATAVEYHEGEAAYNREVVMDHVKTGFENIINRTNYPQEAAMIAGYHHEYYGNPGGYGVFRAHASEHKKGNPNTRQNNCISYDLAPVLECRALAYFPAKILEIIDVFDSITDPNRKYRKNLSTNEALAMMREDFVEKQQKIDAVLFDMFCDFATSAPSEWQQGIQKPITSSCVLRPAQ